MAKCQNCIIHDFSGGIDKIDIVKEAETLGFDNTATFNPVILEARQDIRDMCNADKCMIFGKNWGCPPHCGTVEECKRKCIPIPTAFLCRPPAT